MDEQVFLVRRATLDDLPALCGLWEQENLDPHDLEKRLTEFQVAHDADGKIVGAIGMRREGEHGFVHSEAFTDFGLADQLRTMLWERIKTVVQHYAMARVWMLDCGLYWKKLGFDEADEEILEQLPGEFGAREGNWFSIMLRKDPFAKGTAAAKLQELEFRKALRAESERTMEQAKMVKMVALVLAFIMFVAICLGGFSIFKYQHRMGIRPGAGQR